MHIDMYICMCISNIQPYRLCGRHRWESDAVEMHHALENPTVRPTNAHASRNALSAASSARAVTVLATDWPLPRHAMIFWKNTHTVSTITFRRRVICMFDVCSVFTVQRHCKTHTTKKMPLRCLKKERHSWQNFPSKITLKEKVMKRQFQIPRMTWQCPGKWSGQKSPEGAVETPRSHHHSSFCLWKEWGTNPDLGV